MQLNHFGCRSASDREGLDAILELLPPWAKYGYALAGHGFAAAMLLNQTKSIKESSLMFGHLTFIASLLKSQ